MHADQFARPAMGAPVAAHNPFAVIRPDGYLMAPSELPAEGYWSQQEILNGLEAQYGPGTSQLVRRAESGIAHARAGLAIAFAGGSLADILMMLNMHGNHHAEPLARHLQNLAQSLRQRPVNLGQVRQALNGANQEIVPFAAQHPDNTARMDRLFRGVYGHQAPRNYGQGAFGNEVHQNAPRATNVPPGQFVTQDPSRAGQNALQAALSQIGVREASGNNDGIPAQRYAGGRQEPWCADFVAWSFRQSGHPLPGNQRSLASVSRMERTMQNEGRWFARGSAQPQPGDIIFFQNRGNSDRGGGRHVGIVREVRDGRVHTVEGNSGNQVRERSYPLDASRITGYGRA
jgi:cell wall-associated NlpC family hydrolase